jgi:hypothetical protein
LEKDKGKIARVAFDTFVHNCVQKGFSPEQTFDVVFAIEDLIKENEWLKKRMHAAQDAFMEVHERLCQAENKCD